MMGSKYAHGCAQNVKNALTFLEQYHKDGDEFLNLIVQVICECQNQRAVKAVDAHTFAK
jgi:hypothetical protein